MVGGFPSRGSMQTLCGCNHRLTIGRNSRREKITRPLLYYLQQAIQVC